MSEENDQTEAENDSGMVKLEQVIAGGVKLGESLGLPGELPVACGYGAAGLAIVADHFGQGTIVDQAVDVDG